jgi:glycosyltransferase involved in cell wall biosynthesis
MPTGPALVSVVIPCYNYGRYLAECVASVRAQNVGDVEVIVVDDGSTDSTPAVTAGLVGPRTRIIRHPANQGLLAALTDGIAATTGRYVARIDADDRYRPGFFGDALAMFDAHPEVGMVYGDVAAMDPGGHVTEDPWTGIRSRARHDGRDACGDECLVTLAENVIPTAAMIARGDLYRRALPFPDWFTSHEPSDWYLNLRIAREHPVYYRARTFGDYRLHPQNMHGQPMALGAYERTVLGVLDEMLSGPDPVTSDRAVRRRLYAHAHLWLGDNYFGRRQGAHARRCYLRALGTRPACALRPDVLRHLAATLVPRPVYERFKRAIR